MDAEGWRHAIGGIELGGASDSFAADLGTWSPQDYEAQWREAIARLAGGERSSALITSYGGPRATFHSVWPMWRIKDQVIFHEQLVPGEVVAGPDIAAHFYAAVGDHRTHSEEGEPISEWTVPLTEVLAFAASA